MDDCGSRLDSTAVNYWMNRLQGLDSPEQYLVTLNARDRIDPAKVIAVMDYEHPIYDLPAIEATLVEKDGWPAVEGPKTGPQSRPRL